MSTYTQYLHKKGFQNPFPDTPAQWNQSQNRNQKLEHSRKPEQGMVPPISVYTMDTAIRTNKNGKNRALCFTSKLKAI
jgi:hypothetical protein